MAFRAFVGGEANTKSSGPQYWLCDLHSTRAVITGCIGKMSLYVCKPSFVRLRRQTRYPRSLREIFPISKLTP